MQLVVVNIYEVKKIMQESCLTFLVRAPEVPPSQCAKHILLALAHTDNLTNTFFCHLGAKRIENWAIYILVAIVMGSA